MNLAAERTLKIISPIVVGVLLIAVWQVYAEFLQGRNALIPSPTQIIADFVEHLGIILSHTWITAGNALIGLIVGAILAIVLAALAAWLKVIDWMAAPIVAAIAVVPIVALTPIFNAMYGASSQFGRQAIAGIAAFVPVFINVLRGLKQTKPVQRDLFRAYSASGAQTFRRLTLPTALPYLMTGIRIASSVAVISALVAEYFGGPSDGLGTKIATVAKSGDQAFAWAFVFAAIGVGLVFFLATLLLEWLVTRRRGT